MRRFARLPLTLLLAVAAFSPAAAAGEMIPVEFLQTWKILLETLDGAEPCDAAEVELLLRDGRNRKVSRIRVPLPAAAGRATADWPLTFGTAGEFRLVASIRGCRGRGSGRMSHPVFVHPISEERFVHVQVLPGPKGYHLSRLYVNRERIGDGLFELEFDPDRIRNLTGRPLVPCRRTPTGEVEYFAQMGPEWRRRGDFEVAGGHDTLEPGEWVPLEPTASYLYMSFGGPGTVREVVRINYREADSNLYPAEIAGEEEPGKSPPFCDAYFIEIWGPKPPPESRGEER